MMLHIKNQGSRPCGFRQEDFFKFSYISLCKACDFLGGAFFGPNKLCRGPLDDAIYQISRL